jgi:hypothetical protein
MQIKDLKIFDSALLRNICMNNLLLIAWHPQERTVVEIVEISPSVIDLWHILALNFQ